MKEYIIRDWASQVISVPSAIFGSTIATVKVMDKISIEASKTFVRT